MRSFAICLFLAPCLLHCGSRGSSALVDTPTAIEVSPEGFGLDGACGVRGSGVELLSYVATLVDLTDPTQEEITAPPTPCDQAVLFTNVNGSSRAPHLYVADLIAFDRDDLVARTRGGVTEYLSDGESIEPRWKGSCGRLNWDEATRQQRDGVDDLDGTDRPSEDSQPLAEAGAANADAGTSDAGTSDAGTSDAGIWDAGGGVMSTERTSALDAGSSAAGDPLPLLPDYVPDSGFYQAYWGPQYAVSRRVVTLRGCYLLEVSP